MKNFFEGVLFAAVMLLPATIVYLWEYLS